LVNGDETEKTETAEAVPGRQAAWSGVAPSAVKMWNDWSETPLVGWYRNSGCNGPGSHPVSS